MCQVFKRLEHSPLYVFNFYSFNTSRKKRENITFIVTSQSATDSKHITKLTAYKPLNLETHVEFNYFFITLFSFYLKILVNIDMIELTMTSAWSIYQSGPLGAPLLDYMIYS